MKTIIDKFLKLPRTLWDRYPVIIAAIAIYLYYLLTSLNLFEHDNRPRTFVDYLMQFDSLIFMWIAAAALLQLQRFRKSHQKAEDRRRDIEHVLDRQQIYGQLVNDITLLLQDNVNNPLAVIAVTTQEIRRRFEKDSEIIRWLDRIDGAMQRIHNTIRDLQAYESQKMMDDSNALLSEKIRRT